MQEGNRIPTRRSEVKVAGLLYHHVGPRRPGTLPSLTVSPEAFERHLNWLKHAGYTAIAPSEWLAYAREGKQLPQKPVVLTFDDGYADLVQYAVPALQRHGFKAAIYVVTDRLGGCNEWDMANGSGPHRLLTAQQVKGCAESGIEIGAHTCTHPDLTTVSPDVLYHEVQRSAVCLRELIGSDPISFAYPFGFHNAAVRKVVAGFFPMAWTVEEGRNDPRTDLHGLRRTMVQAGDTFADFMLRVRFGASHIERLRLQVARWRGRIPASH